MSRLPFGALAAAVLVGFLLKELAWAPPRTSVIVFAGGGFGGSTYSTLTGFARIIRRHTGLDVRVIPSGGLISLAKLGRNEIQGAIGNEPFIGLALRGEPPFDRAYPDLRAVMQSGAGLNVAHLAVSREVPVASLAELVAARHPVRIAVDRKGTTDNWIFEELLRYHGASPRAIVAWGGSVREAGYAEQARLLADGHVDAVFQNSQIPSASLIESSYRRRLRLLSLSPGVVEHMVGLGWAAQPLPQGPYERLEGGWPVATIGYSMPFIVHGGLPDSVVYEMTRALCENAEETRAVHRSWRKFDPSTAWQGTGIDLHPGSARFFRERGYMGEELSRR